MLTLGSTASESWGNNRPDTSAFTDHQIEALFYALIRWDQPAINRVLAGLTPPFDAEEDRAAARRLLPFLVEAIIDALEQEGERSGAGVGRAQARERLDAREKRSMLKMIKGIALLYRYDPYKPGPAVTKFLSDLSELSEAPKDRSVLDRNTVNKFFGLAWSVKLTD
jgi:hypothetical protein